MHGGIILDFARSFSKFSSDIVCLQALSVPNIVNKNQNQSLKRDEINLTTPSSSHCQIYFPKEYFKMKRFLPPILK